MYTLGLGSHNYWEFFTSELSSLFSTLSICYAKVSSDHTWETVRSPQSLERDCCCPTWGPVPSHQSLYRERGQTITLSAPVYLPLHTLSPIPAAGYRTTWRWRPTTTTTTGRSKSRAYTHQDHHQYSDLGSRAGCWDLMWSVLVTPLFRAMLKFLDDLLSHSSPEDDQLGLDHAQPLWRSWRDRRSVFPRVFTAVANSQQRCTLTLGPV